MTERLVLVRHGDDPPDDGVALFAAANALIADFRRPFRGEALPTLDETIRGVVLYGGPYEVYDIASHRFLSDEHRYIQQCLERNVPLLGICQGAQSIAHVLGAHVGPSSHGASEFGFYELTPTNEGRGEFLTEPLVMPQNHFHGFDTPVGAVNLASTGAFPHQAFRVTPRAYGLQFHPEVTADGFRRWQDAPWARWSLPGAQTREEQTRLLSLHGAAQRAWFDSFLQHLFGERAGSDDERSDSH